jgi:hypothetical protein
MDCYTSTLYKAKSEKELAVLFKKWVVYIKKDGAGQYHAFNVWAPNEKDLWEKVIETWRIARRETTKKLLKDINYGRRV